MNTRAKKISSIVFIILIIPLLYLLFLEGTKTTQSANSGSEKSADRNKTEQRPLVDDNLNKRRIDRSYKGKIQYNFIILLDLSDRLTKNTPQENTLQVEKDKEIIRNLLSIFVGEVKAKLYINSQDSIKIAVAPQPTGYSPLLFSISKELEIDMRELRIRDRRTKLDQYISNFSQNIDRLYDVSSQEKKLIGADIWTFFRDNLKTFMSKPGREETRNILIILTDGYIDFNKDVLRNRPSQGKRYSYMRVADFRNDKDWEKKLDGDYGLIPINEDFSSLEVLVLGIAPRFPNPNEYKIIEKHWTKWFDKMKIRHSELHKSEDLQKQTENIIEAFLNAYPPVSTSLN